MNISVGNINPLNPDVNICSLMQLIGMGVAEQTTEKESCDENGNSFIRMMQQTLSELLQYDYSDQSTETGSSLQVSESLDQIHQETSTAEETQMTPGYAMIMPFGKTDRFAQAKVQEMPMVEMEVAKNKTTDLPTQVTAQVVATAEPQEPLAAKPEAAAVIRQTVEVRPQEVHQQRQAPENIIEPSPIRNASAHVLSGYEEIATVEPQEPLSAKPEAAPVIRQTVEARPQEVHQQRQAPENIIEPSPIRNASAHVLSGYEEIATVEPQEPLSAKPEAAPVIRQTVEARPQEVHQHRQAHENITEPAPIRNASAHVLSGYEEIATAEPQEPLSAKPEAAPVIRQTVEARPQEVHQQRQAPENITEPTPIRNASAHVLSGYEEIATAEPQEPLSAKPEAAPVIRQTVEARPQEVHQQRQAPENITEPTPIRNASAHVLSGYEEIATAEPQEPLSAKPEAAPVIRQTVEARPQEVHQHRQAHENITEPAPIRNASAHVLSGYEEIATAEPQEPLSAKPEAAPVIRQTVEARPQEVHQQRQAPENITEPAPIRNASAHVLSGYEEIATVEPQAPLSAKPEAAPVIRQTVEARPQEVHQHRQAHENITEPAPIRNASAHVLSGYEEIATAEPQEPLSAKPEAAPVIRQTVEARPQEVHQQRQAPENITEPAPIRNASAHVLSGYEEIATVEPQAPLSAKPEAAPVIRQTVEARPQEVHQHRQAHENIAEPAPIRNASAHVLSGYEEIATAEPQEPLSAKPEAAPVIRQTVEARPQEVHQQRQAPENITEPAPIRNASAHVLSGYEEIATVEPQAPLSAKPEAAPVIRQTVEARPQEVHQHRQAHENIAEPAPIRNASAHVLSGYEEIATAEPQEPLSAKPEAAPVIRQTVEARPQDVHQQRQAPENITEPAPIRNASAHVLSGYEEIATVEPQAPLSAKPEAAPVIRQTVEARPQEVHQHRQAHENIAEPAPIRNASAHVLSGYEEIATVEPQESLSAKPEAAPVIRQTVEARPQEVHQQRQAPENITEPAPIRNASAPLLEGAADDQAIHSHKETKTSSANPFFVQDHRNELKMNSVLQEQTGQKQENAMSGDQETPFTDKQQAQVRHDAKNFAEKNAPAGTDFSAVMGKMKMENKAKVLPGDKNPEMNLSGSAMTAGGSSRAVGTEMNPSQIINRVASEFRENLSNEGGRIKIILAPPSLGTLEMDVAVYHSKVRVLLTAENQDVQKMLSGNIDALKGALQNQGLNIDRCDVLTQDRKEQFAQNSGQEAFQRESDRRGQNESNEYRRGETTEVLARKVTLLQSEARRSGKISLFA